MQNEEEIIDDILDEIDFAKVQKVMECLDWTWYINGDVFSSPEVPSLGQLRKCARSLMKKCLWHETYTTSTGGFHVQKETFDGFPYYSLKFVVTEWNNYE